MTSPVVLITGASRGIGAATAEAFGRAGWRVAITARTVALHGGSVTACNRPEGGLEVEIRLPVMPLEEKAAPC